MKILFVAPRYHTNQHFVVKTLMDHGHEVRFFALYRTLSEEYSALEPEIIEYSLFFKVFARFRNDPPEQPTKFKLKYAFPGLVSFYMKLRGFRPDIIIIRELTNFSIVSMLIAKVLFIKVIYYSQEPQCAPEEAGRRKTILSLLEKLTGKPVIKVTPVPGDCKIHSPRSNTHYLPFVVDFNFAWKEKKYFQNNFINILMVGKYIRRKNHKLLLQACDRLKDEFPIHLTIIVGQEENVDYGDCQIEIQKYLKEKELQTIVDIKTNLSFNEMQQEYREHDLFVLPSTDEPFGVSVLEAMGYGLPVICSDSNGARYCIRETENGHVFNSDDVNDLTEKIRLVIESRHTLVSMGRASFYIAKNEYGPETYYSKFIEVAQKL